MRLVEKVILISGSGRGTGREMMRLFSDQGAIVIGGDMIEPESETPPSAEDVFLDVTNEESWGGVVDKIVSKHGRIDVLVNNAGVLVTNDILDLTPMGWDRSISVNQTGVWLGMRAVICNGSETDRSLTSLRLGAKSPVPDFTAIMRRKER